MRIILLFLRHPDVQSHAWATSSAALSIVLTPKEHSNMRNITEFTKQGAEMLTPLPEAPLRSGVKSYQQATLRQAGRRALCRSRPTMSWD